MKIMAAIKARQIIARRIDKYVMQLADTQSLEQVDAISGATVSYIQFVEAVKSAVDKANQ